MMAASTASAFTGASVLLDRGTRDRLRLAWRLFRDERVSALKFALPALLTLYVISPLDPIPDFLLGVGQVDDLGVVIALLMLTVRLMPRLAPNEVVAEHLNEMGKRIARHPNGAAAREETIDASFRVRG